MILHGAPLPAILPADGSTGPRFWYWHGASGRRYIHSVYPADACPPLPGAIFIAVKRTGTLRTALAVGRFSVFWDAPPETGNPAAAGADEFHVHLLAGDEQESARIAADLGDAFRETAASDNRQLAAA